MDFTPFNKALGHVIDGTWTREQAAQFVGMTTDAYSDVYGTLIDAMQETGMSDQGYVGKVESITGGKGRGVIHVTVRYAIPLDRHDEVYSWADKFVTVRPLNAEELSREEAFALEIIAAGSD